MAILLAKCMQISLLSDGGSRLVVTICTKILFRKPYLYQRLYITTPPYTKNVNPYYFTVVSDSNCDSKAK